MSRIVIYHSSYGCETGCCGHVVARDDGTWFDFSHPNGGDPLEYAKDLIRKEFGEEHVKDLDWENSEIYDD